MNIAMIIHLLILFSLSLLNSLPQPTLPRIDLFPDILFDTCILAIVCFAVSLSLAKIFAKKHKYSIDANQELIALGSSNVFASFFAAFRCSAALSRSTLQEKVGGRTQIAGLVSSAIILAVLLLFAPYLYHLPKVSSRVRSRPRGRPLFIKAAIRLLKRTIICEILCDFLFGSLQLLTSVFDCCLLLYHSALWAASFWWRWRECSCKSVICPHSAASHVSMGFDLFYIYIYFLSLLSHSLVHYSHTLPFILFFLDLFISISFLNEKSQKRKFLFHFLLIILFCLSLHIFPAMFPSSPLFYSRHWSKFAWFVTFASTIILDIDLGLIVGISVSVIVILIRLAV